jgi:hypothetical protein
VEGPASKKWVDIPWTSIVRSISVSDVVPGVSENVMANLSNEVEQKNENMGVSTKPGAYQPGTPPLYLEGELGCLPAPTLPACCTG